jgi:hypothetical protein
VAVEIKALPKDAGIRLFCRLEKWVPLGWWLPGCLLIVSLDPAFLVAADDSKRRLLVVHFK